MGDRALRDAPHDAGTSIRIAGGRCARVMMDTDNEVAAGGSVNAPDRRSHERRVRVEDRRFWRALNNERRVSQRRRADVATAPAPARGSSWVRSTEPDVALETDPQPLTELLSRTAARHETVSTRGAVDETAKRQRLKAMLEVAERRHERSAARRGIRPRFASGVRLQVVRGALADRRGTLLDADYIHARGLIELDGAARAVWIAFADLRAEPTD